MKKLYRRIVGAIIEWLVNHSCEYSHPSLLAHLCQMYNLSLVREIWQNCPEGSVIAITWKCGHPEDDPHYNLFEHARKKMERLLSETNTSHMGGGWHHSSSSISGYQDGAFWDLFKPTYWTPMSHLPKVIRPDSKATPLTWIMDLWILFKVMDWNSLFTFRIISNLHSKMHPLTLITDFEYFQIPSEFETQQQ